MRLFPLSPGAPHDGGHTGPPPPPPSLGLRHVFGFDKNCSNLNIEVRDGSRAEGSEFLT